MVMISNFQAKDVVNVADGKKLGNIGDLEINLSTGQIESIIITGSGRMLRFFGTEDEVVIPWRNIVKVGADVILVRSYHKSQVEKSQTQQSYY